MPGHIATVVARPELTLLVAVALVASACGMEPEDRPRPVPTGPPSIVLISIDTTRADRLGSYGFTPAATPNLDTWASEGVVFESASTPAPITLPAHASMLTGLFPHRHGARDNGIYRLPDDVPTVASRLSAEGYDTRAIVAAAVLDRQYGLGRGFARYDDGGRSAGAGLAIAERNAEAVTDAALSAAANLTPPFFLFVHYFDPHAAYSPPAPFAERYRSSPYQGELAFVDDQIGRLRADLESRDLLDDTVVVITSDHGEGLGEHGESTHGVFLYQSTIHVPLIVVAPGRWPAGERVSAPVSLVDIAPTLYDLAGVAPPSGLDGRVLDPSYPPASRGLPLESELGFNAYGWAPLVGLIDGRWKWVGAPRPELYDLSSDPDETNNLADERTGDVARLAALYRDTIGDDRRVELGELTDATSAARLAELRSLGYVAGSRGDAHPRDAPPTDPKDAIASLESIHDARRLMSENRPAEAAHVLEEVVAVSPRNVSALVLSGAAYIMDGRPERALEPLHKAERAAPANADVRFNLGLAWLGVNRPDEAEAAWKRSLELAPRHEQAAINVIDLLIKTARPDEAESILDAARERDLSGPVFDYLEGKIAILQGDRARATASLSRALSGSLPPPIADDARRLLDAVSPDIER